MKKIKLIDSTLRQIFEICDKNNKKCSECPLFPSALDCQNFNLLYNTDIEYRRKLEKEEYYLENFENEYKLEQSIECKKITAREIIELIENLTIFPAKVNEQDADYICDLIAEKYDLEIEK